MRNDFVEIERYASKEGKEEVWLFEIFEKPDSPDDPVDRFRNPFFELTRNQVETLITLIQDMKNDNERKVCDLEGIFRRGGEANCGVKSCPAKKGHRGGENE